MVSCYQFIAAEKADFPVVMLCRLVGVARAGYDAWERRGPSARAQADAKLQERLEALQARSQQTYGRPRLQTDLAEEGWHVSGKRVARLMRQGGLQGASRGQRKVTTTTADPVATPAPNLVARQFAVEALDRLWVGDITYVATAEGWLYLAVLLDACSRRVVGWAMADHLRTELALDALRMALRQRRPAAGQLVHHTDRGCQDTAAAYRAVLTAHEVTGSMSRAGNGDDNAMAESFFGTLKAELLHLSMITFICRLVDHVYLPPFAPEVRSSCWGRWRSR